MAGRLHFLLSKLPITLRSIIDFLQSFRSHLRAVQLLMVNMEVHVSNDVYASHYMQHRPLSHHCVPTQIDQICKQSRQYRLRAAKNTNYHHGYQMNLSSSPSRDSILQDNAERYVFKANHNLNHITSLYADSFLEPKPSADLPRSSKLGFSCAASPLLTERSFFAFCSPVPSVTMLPSPPRPQW
jgi:hypothetical protein